MKKNRKWIYIGLGILFIILVVAAVIKGKSSKKGISVTISKVEKRTIKEVVAGSGKIYPEIEVKISSDVSGEIVRLMIKEGDSVKANQVLAIVNPDTYESIVERANASLNNSKAQLANSRARILANIAQKEQIAAQLKTAKKSFERSKKLFEQSVIAESDYEKALSNFEGLQANLKSAEANIQSAKESAKAAEYMVKSAQASLKESKANLKRTTIVSPIDGIITMLAVEEGERVVGTIQMKGTELMRISNLNNMEVRVEISENDILKVKKGDKVEIEVDAYVGKKFYGEVFEVANSSSDISNNSLNSDKVTNFIVKVRIDQKSYKDLIDNNSKTFPFRPGMSATVDIFTKSKSGVISVPIQAVTTREVKESKDGEPKGDLDEVVFVVQSDTVSKVKVKTGIQDDEYIEILDGVDVGDNVVTGPYRTVSKKLKEGDKVTEKKDKKKD